jgi:hypothetical protein
MEVITEAKNNKGKKEKKTHITSGKKCKKRM